MLFLIKPDQAAEVFVAGINSRFETNLVFGNTVLQTLLWIIIVFAVIVPSECKDPKVIGQIFGISYVYSLFWKWGLIRVTEKVKEKLRGKYDAESDYPKSVSLQRNRY